MKKAMTALSLSFTSRRKLFDAFAAAGKAAVKLSGASTFQGKAEAPLQLVKKVPVGLF